MEYSLLPSQAPHLAREEKLHEDKESDSGVSRPNQMRAAKSFEGFRFPRRAPTPSHFNYQRFIKLHLELPGNPRAGGAEMFPEEQPGGPGGAGTEINPGTFPKFRAGRDAVVGFFLAPLKSLHQSRGFPGSQQKAPGLHCCVIPKKKPKTGYRWKGRFPEHFHFTDKHQRLIQAFSPHFPAGLNHGVTAPRRARLGK